ncbi:hypothetical protein SUGI_0522800 [Cryptomeria japonica]|uniref:uncharacterized protein LOC131077722 n=1 Tax=Cryptomeria japonica TaxID=3369 RepID=UPI002408B07A|nr:uncharacterized protein LOC131077722 [Cryptomeria japonica]GLJ26799.1 hypothetical protein SUGI_0522800 [Cryptomeria japonica]
MAVRRQPLAVIQDENAEINRGKTNVAKSGGLKVQQTDVSDRKTLANITNKLKTLPNLGVATPSTLRNGKGGISVRVDPELSGKSGVKGRTVPRTPLGNIENVDSSVQKGKTIEENKAHSKNVKWGPNPNYEVTEEMKQQAEIWAREGIEKCHFTGKDMDALHEKMAEEEVNRRVAQALSYRSEIPCWLPSALVEPTEIKDCLELVPEEDLLTNFSSSFHGKEQHKEQQDIDYDESFYEFLDILLASKGPPVE